MNKSNDKKWEYWIFPAGLIVWSILVYWSPTTESAAKSILPACPVRVYSGLFCPGCGATRSLHHLLHGDFAASLRFHPLLIAALIYVLVGWLSAHFKERFTLATALNDTFYRNRIIYGILAVLLIFTVARNLPFEYCEWLRPPANRTTVF